jgi:hypothetical protein
MMRDAASILLVGDTAHAEFSYVPHALTWHGAVRHAKNLADLDRDPPQLCFLLQRYPGEFPAHELDSLLRRWPLTRFVTVAGSLCEGEPRSGQPWAGQVRIYWHEFPGWWALQRKRIVEGQAAEWALPRTSREEDVVRNVGDVQWQGLDGLIGVVASRRSGAAHCLLDVLRMANLAGVLLPGDHSTMVTGLRCLLWDDADPDGKWRDELRALSHAWSGVPILALMNYPRVADREWLEEQFEVGAAVLGKPYDVDVLLATLACVAATPDIVRES